MECTEASERMREWALGAAIPASARLHLASCPACEALWRQEKELTAALAALRAEARESTASLSVKAAVLSALPAAAPSRHQRRWDWRPLLAVAAVLIAVIVAGWYRSRPQPAQTQRQAALAGQVYTDFFPLSAVALGSQEPAQLVRIKLPRREMRRFGLPVSDEWERSLVDADVLVGQVGIARAVRFVSTSH